MGPETFVRHLRNLPAVTLPVVLAVAWTSWLTAAPTDGGGDAARLTVKASLLQALDSGGLDAGLLAGVTRDPDPEVRELAARVIAATADPADVRQLARFWRVPDPRVQAAVALAAGRIGRSAGTLAAQGLVSRSPMVRGAAAWASAHTGAVATEPLIELVGRERDPAVLEVALANLWRLNDPRTVKLAARYAGHKDPLLRRAAAYGLSRAGTAEAHAVLRKFTKDAEAVVRAVAANGLGRGEIDAEDRTVVRRALADDDWRVQAAACATIAGHDGWDLKKAEIRRLVTLTASPRTQLAISAVRALGRLDEGGGDDLFRFVSGEVSWRAGEALQALARRGDARVAPAVKLWLTEEDVMRARAAAAAVAALEPASAELDEVAVGNAGAAVRLAWLETLDEVAGARRLERVQALADSDPDPTVRAQALSVLRTANQTPSAEWLHEKLGSWAKDPMPDARIEVLQALLAAASTDEQRAAVVDLAAADADPVVVGQLVRAGWRLGVERRLPRRRARHPRAWDEQLVRWQERGAALEVTTERGSFTIRLDTAVAPLTTREIWELAGDGFYDGLTFHRVVPNFVVQGGDPRGDGWGGPGFVVPDEPSLVPFDSWRVGIATSGPNTGGCQLFAMLLPADHLTGHYTNLGEVVEGRSILTQLEVGDRITKVRPLTPERD